MSASSSLGRNPHNGLVLGSPPDMGDGEAQLDARHQLRMCSTDADYAAWARRWGEAVLDSIESLTAGGRRSAVVCARRNPFSRGKGR